MTYRIIIEPSQTQHNRINLTAEQKHYLKNVLRLNSQDNFIALDGKGNTYLAQLLGEKAEIIKSLKEVTELPVSVTLMVALPKGNGFDDTLRSCTELGVNSVIPVLSERTLLKPSPHKVQRWRKIVREATEQSERQIVPTIADPIFFTTALTKVAKTNSNCYICVTRRNAKHLLTYLSDSSSHSIIIATGCEGGWTEREVTQAVTTGFQPVTLGSRILRAVTAPIACLSLVAAVFEQSN